MAENLANYIPALRHKVAKLKLTDLEGAGTITFGNIFFVDSGSGSDSNVGTSPETAFATIDYAIGFCTANNGDIIYVLPGHDENPTTSITMDVAGVSIIGLGRGSSRPTVTFGAEAAAVNMSAASGFISNIRFDLGTVAATVTNCFNITADSCWVDNCETVVHATSQFTNLLTATDAQFVKITNNKFHSLETAGATSGVVVDGCDDIEIIGNQIAGHFGEHALDNTTPGSCDEILRAYIAFNTIRNDSSTGGDLAVEMDAAATGVMAYNTISGGLALASNVDYGDMRMIQNYLTDAVDVTAVVSPTTAAS
jgi:hypothetical protein